MKSLGISPNNDSNNQLSLPSSSNVLKKGNELAFEEEQQESSNALVLCKHCGSVSPSEISSQYWEELHRETREFLPLQQEEEETTSSLPKFIINQGYFSRFFKMVHKIGKGASGAVYLCKHFLNGVFLGTYALKIVPVGNNSKWLERMLHEVRLLENFRHENVVNYKHTWIEIFQPSAFGIPVPCLFILMEHADAGNLEDFVERHYPRYSSCNEILLFRFSPFHFEREPYSVKVKNLALQICRGIQHLHDMKIIHHDLKPQNILLKKSGTGYCALISDFGECEFVHSVGSRIRTGATGTLEYMAPELLRTDKCGKYLSGYSESSDIWSFGMVLFNMCYGTLPFEAESLEDSDAVAKEIMHLNGVKISFPSNPSMEPFNQIICNCLQQNPKARPTIDQILGQIAAIELLEEKKRQQQQPKLNKYSRSILFLTLVAFLVYKLAFHNYLDAVFGMLVLWLVFFLVK